MSDEQYRQLVEDVIVSTVPTTGEPSPVVPQAEALERGHHRGVGPGLPGATGAWGRRLGHRTRVGALRIPGRRVGGPVWVRRWSWGIGGVFAGAPIEVPKV